MPAQLATESGGIHTASESGTAAKPHTASSSHNVPEPDTVSTTSVDELARACSEHLKLESTSTKKIDNDLSLAVQLQMAELKSSTSMVDQQAPSARTEPTVGTRKPDTFLSSDNLPKICSGKVLEHAKKQLGSGSDLDLALRLQWEEVTRNERNRSEHPSAPARSATDPADQRLRHSAANRQTGQPPQAHSSSRPTISQRSASNESTDNCTIL